MSAELLPLLPVEPAQPVRTGRPGCGQLSADDGRPLPLKALHVDSALVGMTASSTVRQRFVNAGDTTIEATYVFPLPARAGVTEFSAELAGRRVIGVLKERGQARADYEQALVSGQRAAIVEEDRSDVFSVRVGNVGPGEEATIEMRLTGPLSFEDGEATFRFPLVVAPRYTAGTPLPGDQTGAGTAADTDAVPDASRVTPPRLLESDERPDLQISLSLDGAGFAVSDLRSSLPTAVSEADGTTRLQVQPGARADRDFVLRFRVDRSELSSSALLVPDAEGEEGTWSVTLVPPVQTASAPRDVVVLLDRSGSMHGWKMIAARRAAGRIVDMLDAADRFCVLAFDDRIDTPTGLADGLVEATDRNRFAAASWLGSLESRGGTVMAEPLYQAAGILAGTGEDRQASIVLVTDGQVTGEDHLLRMLAPAVGRTRIYCVGIDRAVNAGFLDRLAGLGHGRSELVESEERLDDVMARLARTIGRPALTSVRVRAEGVSLLEGTVTPGLSPDAFAGIPCVISGRYRGASDATFHVEADDSVTITLPAQLAPEAVAVRTIWARSVVRDLEDDYASYAADDELAARLVAHSIRFGVLSRFTAFVAVDPERTDAGPLTEVVQPVEQPSGWATNVGFARAGGAYSAAAEFVMPAPAGAMPPPAGAAPEQAAPAKPAPLRPLDKLLKQVEKATQVRRSGLDAVLDELKRHRDTATDPELRAALDQLCAALAHFLEHPTGPQSRQVLVKLDAVRRAMTGADRPVKRRFWQ
ncbi:VIT domain-containing protein [Mycobacterium gordonae]|uniref:VIT domain-containing protein n=1 Tax=Mycobacterium gordonae TaxID=1778 RepID=UPI0009F16BA8|nr:VIT domain-containing protein [Mycobacterium gordonae]